jgi:hypothetical protein
MEKLFVLGLHIANVFSSSKEYTAHLPLVIDSTRSTQPGNGIGGMQ